MWDDLVAQPFSRWRELTLDPTAPSDDWRSAALVSGYPTLALDLATEDERAIWYRGFVDT